MLKYSEIKNLAEDEKNLPLLNKIAARFGISDFKNHISKIEGFTLAEMLVVMLIASIFIAATMPIVTKRTKTLSEPIIDEIWKFTTNHADIYFEEKVNIGTKDIHNAQLYVSSKGSSANPQIGLNNGVDGDAFLRYGQSNKFIFGSGTADAESDGGIVIGRDAKTYNKNSIAIGTGAQVSTSNIAADLDAMKGDISVSLAGERTESPLFIYLHYHVGYQVMTYYIYTVLYYRPTILYYYFGYTSQTYYSYNSFYGQTVAHTYYYMTYLPVWGSEPVMGTVVAGYYYAFDYSVVFRTFSSYRNPTASGIHHISAKCPAAITVKNNTTGISQTVYLPEDGTELVMHNNPVHLGHGSYFAFVSSRAIYASQLAQYHNNGDIIYGGHCWHGLRNLATGGGGYANTYFHQLLTNAVESIYSASVDAVTAQSGIAIGDQASASNAGSVAIGYKANSTVRSQIVLGGSGSTLKVGGATVSTSDIRLKNIKGFYHRGLKELRKLKTYLFSFKDDETNSTRIGLIAQDVQKVMPEAIGYSDSDGHLAIKNEFITYAMFNAILDLDDSLRAVIKRQFVLERKVAKQEARIKKLEKMIDELSKK